MDLRNLGTRRKQNTTGTSKTHQVQAKRDQINTMGTAMRFPRYPKNHQTRATRRQIKSNRLPKSAQKKKRKKQTEQTGNKKKKAQVTSPPPDHPKNASQLEFISNPYNNRQESRPNSTEKNPRDAKNKKIHLASSSWLSSSSSSWTPFGALLRASTEDPFLRKFLLSVRWHTEIVFLKSPFLGCTFWFIVCVAM